jgi:hypothetical protein
VTRPPMPILVGGPRISAIPTVKYSESFLSHPSSGMSLSIGNSASVETHPLFAFDPL